MAFLTAVNGPKAGKRFDVVGEALVGRHHECQICIPEVGAVSRYHAKITCQGGDFYIEDLKSRNGTLVNGELLSARRKLQHGDVVRICDVEFTFETDKPPSATAPISTKGGGLAIFVDDQGTASG